MAIKKTKLDDNYASIPNSTLRDPRLSLEAVGLLAYLLSLPEDWEVRATQIQKQFGIGRVKQCRLYKELEGAGYLEKQNGRGVDGRWISGVTIYQTSRN